MSSPTIPQAAMNDAVRHLVTNYNPKGNKIGWLMMSSILVEAWDLYSIAFVLVFIKAQYNPDPLLLGLAAAATQGGALFGAIAGGWLADKIGRRSGLCDERGSPGGDPLHPRRAARLRHL